MATPCPNCGKSIRSGARFCGFCGHVLGEPSLAPPPSAAAPLEQRAADNPCPHCGKPNRQGVKFCASCGKALAPAATAPVPAPPPGTGPAAPQKRRRSRMVTIGFLAAIAVIVCGSLFGIAWATGLLDGILPSRTPAVPEVADVDTVEPSGAEEQTPVQSPTDTIEPTAEAPTETGAPTETDIPPTETPTGTPTPTATNTPEPVPSFLEDFTGNLDQWDLWENRTVNGLFPAQIVLGEYLDLKGFDFDKVGATATQPVTLIPGMVIEFEAETNFSLFFDWYPGEETRPTYWLGPVYLEITTTEAVLHYEQAGVEKDCGVALEDAEMKLYRIVFGPDWKVSTFYDDGEVTEICSATIDPPDDLIGRITFSGWGLVDGIVITEP